MKLTIICMLIPVICNGQSISMGIGFAGGNRSGQMGISAEASIIVRAYSHVKLETTRFFKSTSDSNGVHITASSWNINAEFLYHFLQESLISPYVIGGVGVTKTKKDINIPVFHVARELDLTDVGTSLRSGCRSRQASIQTIF